jgi:rhamnose utilization protein RhaD (predicted bifunctional aldolase and dehydrogenase)
VSTHEDLLALCRALGEPGRDLAILGEGNAAARLDPATMLVTTSGSQLATLGTDHLIGVRVDAAVALATAQDGGEIEPEVLAALAVDATDGPARVPSIETLLHALVLDRTGVAFVGHTHPTSVLGLVCSDRGTDAFAAPIFPDEVVVCGPAYLVVPYASPGRALAAALDEALAGHHARHGAWPRAVILVNHGLLALGATPAEVLAVTAMVDKSARIRAAALAVGRLSPLPEAEVLALSRRADEVRRRRLLVEGGA